MGKIVAKMLEVWTSSCRKRDLGRVIVWETMNIVRNGKIIIILQQLNWYPSHLENRQADLNESNSQEAVYAPKVRQRNESSPTLWNNAKRPRKWPGGSGVRIANLMSNDNYKRDQTKHVCRKHGGDASEIFRRSSAAMRCRKVKLLFRYAGWSRSQWSLTWSRKTNWFCEESRTTVLYPTCANKPETQWTKAGQIQIWCVRQSAN